VPVLEQQKNDQDADVRYFAMRALHKALSDVEVTGRLSIFVSAQFTHNFDGR
jgi:hypothetical protein